MADRQEAASSKDPLSYHSMQATSVLDGATHTQGEASRYLQPELHVEPITRHLVITQLNPYSHTLSSATSKKPHL